MLQSAAVLEDGDGERAYPTLDLRAGHVCRITRSWHSRRVNGDIVRALLRETERVEWKESAKDASTMLRAVCALANDLGDSQCPGYLLIGVDDQGQVVGEDTSDEAVQRISNRLRSTRILPHPSCVISVEQAGEALFLAVRVEPYEVPPIVKVDGVAWVRVGTSTFRASDSDLRRLEERRSEGKLPLDLRSVAYSSGDDIGNRMLQLKWDTEREDAPDTETFPDFARWLVQRELLRHTAHGLRATVTGILLYGIDPQAFFPGAQVELARYAGVDFSDSVSVRKTVTGTLIDQLETLWIQLEGLVAQRFVEDEGPRTYYAPDYPPEALRELARNMLQHRDYGAVNAPSRVSWFDDRVVFNNPGGPFGQARQGQFGEHSDYRNPTLTRHLAELGYVERLGRGIRLVRRALEKNGNPDLELEFDGFTTVTVRRKR